MNSFLPNLEISRLDLGSHLHPFTSLSALLETGPVVIESARGVLVRDALGRDLIDAAAGLWCVNVGHGREEIIEAVASQMRRLGFFQTFNGFTHEPVARLAARIMEIAPGGMQRVFFGNSGSDANDSAVKIVWLYNNVRGKPAKRKIIARTGAYHGVTVMSGSLTGLPSVHKHFNLPLEMVRHVAAPDLYRAPSRDAASYADELDALIQAEGADTVAAFIAEPVMGTGGVLTPPDGYFPAIAEVLKRRDVLLILDEVICGFGRLGAWFGAQRFAAQADLITTAKGLTSSYLPMSAVLVGEAVWSVLAGRSAGAGVFNHGFTTSGHPAAAAAALANLDIIEREQLVPRVKALEPHLLGALRRTCENHPLVGNIRGCGLMAGVELVASKSDKRPFDSGCNVAGRVFKTALDEGLLVRALPANDVIAFSPAFVVDEPTIDEISKRFRRALHRVAADLVAEGAWRPDNRGDA